MTAESRSALDRLPASLRGTAFLEGHSREFAFGALAAMESEKLLNPPVKETEVMRRNLLRVMALMAPAILVYASPAQAQLSQPARAIQSSYYEGTEGTGRYLPVSGTKEPVPQAAATAPAGSCGCNNGGCDNGCCDSCCDCCDCWEGCEECPSNTLILFAGIESWRGFADGSWNNNNGAVTGANFGTIISQDYGLGFQFGGSF